MSRKGRKSAAQTSAPKKDRIYLSKTNRQGSAASKESAKSIVFSESIIETLKEKADNFNKTHPAKKVTLSTLKAVFRRGAGAYSKSHRPTISGGKPNSRTAWAYARVNKFLLKKGGTKVKAAYVQDDDLMEFGGEIKLFAPNGKPSNLTPEQYNLVRTPEFKAFFGDWENDPKNASKVVDENGEPLVVYHATDKWELNGAFKNIRRDIHGAKHRDELGIHFGNKEQANQILELWSGKKSTIGKYIKPFFLNVRNLKRVKDRNTWDFRVFEKHYEDLGLSHSKKFESIDEVYEDLKNQKIDGLIYYNEYEGEGDSYLVFDSTQIKLADGSNITFDGSDPDIRFKNGGLLAPNGKKSNLTPEQYKLVRTPQFKAWFGDWENDPANASKVVDVNGEPLVVYHGTTHDFTIFKLEKPMVAAYGQGFYFTNDKGFASNYARGENGKILSIFLNIRKVFEINNDELPSGYEKYSDMEYNKGKSRDFTSRLLQEDYNGVYAKNRYNENELVVFNPNQIKLADGRNTTFDAENPDIRFEQGGLIAPNGRKSNLTPEQYKLVRTPQFKAWFGDWENDPKNASKVVDENGEPLVVHHGTKYDFNTFRGNKLIWATPEIGYIDKMKGMLESNRVIDLFANSRKILDLTEYGYKYYDPKTAYNIFLGNDIKLSGILNQKFGSIFYSYLQNHTEELKDQMMKLGYDGIKVKVHRNYDFSFGFLQPKQIKLADGMNTTFNGNNPDIRYEDGGDVMDDEPINKREMSKNLNQYVDFDRSKLGEYEMVTNMKTLNALEENGYIQFTNLTGRDRLIIDRPSSKGLYKEPYYYRKRDIKSAINPRFQYKKTEYFIGYQKGLGYLEFYVLKKGNDWDKYNTPKNKSNSTFDGNNPDIRYDEGGGIKYEKGGQVKHTFGKYGGYLVGNRHSEGGIKATNKSTGQPLEMEGGEVVITRNAVSDNQKREFEGEMLTNKEILSRINQSGGGVSFADGGEVKSCRCHGKSYKYGGKTMTDFEIVRMMAKQHPDDFKKGIKEELSEHKETFLDLKKAKISITEAAKLVVAEHLQKKPDYYTNYGSGGYITYDQKVIPSLDKFVSKNLGVFMKVDGHLSMYLPITQSGTDIVEYFMDGMTHKPKISRVAAYKKYLLDTFGIDFKKLSVKVKNALLLGKQTFISSN